MIALRRGVGARNRRQIRSSIADRLNTGLLIIGEDDDFARVIALRGGRAPHLDLAVNAKHFGHFWLELGVAPLRVIADLVRLDLMCCQNLTHCSQAADKNPTMSVQFRQNMPSASDDRRTPMLDELR